MASVPMGRERPGATVQRGFTDVRQARLAHALGWFGIGLGLVQLVAPRAFARAVGAGDRPALVRALGAREVASGVGILGSPSPGPWLTARAGGDAMDLALLALALRSPSARPLRLALAAAAVVGVATLDGWSSIRTNRHPRALPRQAAAPGVVPVEHHLWINRSPAECYALWSDFERFPSFMGHLERVEAIDGTRSHWVAKAPAGMRVEWYAEIVERQPDRGIAWRSLPGSTVRHAGAVRFDAAPGGRGTIVRLRILVRPPGGELGARLAGLFGESPLQSSREDLRRFKRLIETGEVPTTLGQPHGRRSALGRIASSVNPS
ncbi:MAG TPA: SRPBCC family protein [Burkholderiaceae bacterium]|nr:SRPBCC family protein [Burkholderiaceae bacterium]